jgi:hypothetical protein
MRFQVLLLSLAIAGSAVRAQDTSSRRLSRGRFGPVAGVHLFGASSIAAYAGIVAVVRDRTVYPAPGSDSSIRPHRLSYSGPAALVEIGIRAGSVSLGWAGVGTLLIPTGIRIQGSALRTWGSSSHLAPGQTFLGVEAQWTVLGGLRIGQFWRVRGDRAGDEEFTRLGLAIGV